MTRTFGYLAAGFWRHPKVRHLDDAARLFMTYLFSCPHGNSVGAFVLPLAYITADLGWDIKQVVNAISACQDAKLIDHDADLDVIRVRGWLNQNLPRNLNVALSMVRNVESLPDCEIKTRVVRSMKAFDNHHIREVVDRLPGGTVDPKAKRPPKKKPPTPKQKAAAELKQAQAHKKLAEAMGNGGWQTIMAAQNPTPSTAREAAINKCIKAAKEHGIPWTPPGPA